MDKENPNQSQIEIKVRYCETDAMGIVYYANYFIYFEVARTTALELLGHPYHLMEKKGCRIPVLQADCKYIKPARYGDNLTIETTRWRIGLSKIRFDYRIINNHDLIASGKTEHAFVNMEGKPTRPPRDIIPLFPALKLA